MSTSEELIFQQALEIQNEVERDAYLETACAGNPELLKSVRSLLNAWRHGQFLESTLPEIAVVRTFGNERNTHQLGPYRIIESLGRGGMGAVFLAEQTEPVQRRVAIKIVRPELDSPNVVRRFLQEQRTLARMDHPNIAKVLDASISEQGISYFVMELVNGVPILEFCQTQDLSIRDRLEMFRECCAAILHAHQNSVIHRDIKPSNTLVTTQHGKPLIKIIDFGIAKALDPKESAEPRTEDTVETIQTRVDEFLGTPQYMSPEQASMGQQKIDTRTDIYSLGALLYSLLTYEPPFDQDVMDRSTFDEVRQLIQHTDPLPPSLRVLRSIRTAANVTKARSGTEDTAVAIDSNREFSVLTQSDRNARIRAQELAGDLDCIVAKAMEKDPNRRYKTVVELSDDVQRYLSSEPILARAPTLLYRLTKFARRSRGLLASIIVASLCLVIGLALAVNQAQRARVAEIESRREAERAFEAERKTAQALYMADLRLASTETSRNKSAAALEILRRHIPEDANSDIRSFDWHYLVKQNTPLKEELFDADHPLYYLTRIQRTSQLACCGEDGNVHLLNEQTGAKERTIECRQGEVNSIAASPDESILATAGDDGTIAYWQLPECTEIRRFKAHQKQAFQLVWSADAKYIATCGNEPDVMIWSAQTDQLVHRITTDRDLECIASSINGDLAIGAEVGGVYLTRFPSENDPKPTVQKFASTSESHCSTVAFSPDGRLLASGQKNGNLLVHTVVNQFREVPLETRLSDEITSAVFDSRDTNLAVGLRNGAVAIIQLNPPDANRLRLTIEGLYDSSGNGLDGNGDGVGTDAWDSTAHQENQSNKPDDSLAELPPRVLRIDPPLQDGMLPLNTARVELRFSKPIENIGFPAAYRFARGSQAGGNENEVVVPSHVSYTEDKTSVTLFLPESPWTNYGGYRENSPVELASELIHESDVSRVTSFRHDGTLISAGNDGRVVRFSPRILRSARPISKDVYHFDFGPRDLWMQGHKEQFFSRVLSDEDNMQQKPEKTDSLRDHFVNVAEQSGDVVFGRGGWDFDQPIGIRILNPATRAVRNLDSLQLSGGIGNVAVSDDGKFLAAGISTRAPNATDPIISACLVNLESAAVTPFTVESYVTRPVFSTGGRFLALPTNHDVQLVDTRDMKTVASLKIPNLRTVAIPRDGRELLSVSDDGTLVVWETSTGQVSRTMNAHVISARCVDINPDGVTVATVGSDGWLRLWRRGVWQVTVEQQFPSPLVHCDFSGDGQYLGVLDERGSVYVLDAGQPMKDMSGESAKN